MSNIVSDLDCWTRFWFLAGEPVAFHFGSFNPAFSFEQISLQYVPWSDEIRGT
jgi:hypothetical protein